MFNVLQILAFLHIKYHKQNDFDGPFICNPVLILVDVCPVLVRDLNRINQKLNNTEFLKVKIIKHTYILSVVAFKAISFERKL